MSFNHPFGGGFRNHPQYDALFLLGHNGGVTLGAQKSHHRVSIHVLSIRILINQEAASWKSFWKKLPRYFPSERKVASQIIIPNLLQIYSIWGFARCFFSASFYLGGCHTPWISMNIHEPAVLKPAQRFHVLRRPGGWPPYSVALHKSDSAGPDSSTCFSRMDYLWSLESHSYTHYIITINCQSEPLHTITNCH